MKTITKNELKSIKGGYLHCETTGFNSTHCTYEFASMGVWKKCEGDYDWLGNPKHVKCHDNS